MKPRDTDTPFPMTPADLLIENALVVTMDKDFRVIENGAVAVGGNRLLGVGTTRDLKEQFRPERCIDGRRKLVLPGLVNTHTHSPMTIYRGFADDIPLREWLYDHIFPIEAIFTDPENVRAGTRLAIAEMLLSGTTTFNDMYYYVDEMARVVGQSGMRAVLNETIIDSPAPNSPTPAEGLAIANGLIENWNGHPLVTIGIGAHAPYSVAADLVRQTKALADRHHLPFNIHVAETRWEFEKILRQHGATPVQYLHGLDVLSPNMVAAHCVHLTEEDIGLLGSHGVGIAHNPQCNMKLGNGIAPIPQLLKMGAKVGIGTDGAASNNDLDMFDEMRSAALSHKLSSGDPTVMDARSVVEAATMGGARVLGMDGQIGSLTVGKKADLIVLDMDKPHAFPFYNIYSLIVYSLRGSDVDSVMVDGRMLVEGRKLLTLDIERLYDKLGRIARQIKKEAGKLGIVNHH